MTTDTAALAAPGVYFPSPVTPPRSGTEPMDVAAFVGVTARGPAGEPVTDPSLRELGIRHARSVAVPVESWGEFVERFGGFDGPGLLPHAVASYFAQGARRAFVVRLVAPPGAVDRIAGHGTDDGEPPGCARYRLTGLPELRSRNEGSWGNNLTVHLRYVTRSLAATPDGSTGSPALALEPGAGVAVGSLVRIAAADGTASLAAVSQVRVVGRAASAAQDVLAILDRPLPPADDDVPATWAVELVEAEVTVVDRARDRLRVERFTGLGVRPAHPRFVTDVLRDESRLVAPVEDGTGTVLEPSAALMPQTVEGPQVPGRDRWQQLTPDDVFAATAEVRETGGVQALATAPEVASVLVPDLYAPATLARSAAAAGRGPVTAGGGPVPEPAPSAAFAPCGRAADPALPAVPDGPALPGLTLDPADAADLARIVALQSQLVEVAERLGVVALLDVPPGLRGDQVLRWRSWFDSSSAAAYHPWLRSPGTVPDGPLEDVPPSAAAAGIIARCELRQGISRGPANEVARAVVDVAERVDDAEHGRLHQLGVNVFRAAPGGLWLTAARTLGVRSGIRQLTTRRLLLLLERSVRRELGWTVFEPGDERLSAGVRRHLDQLLADLFQGGAFAGSTPQECWFVRVTPVDDLGRVVVEVGVAPSEPLEFLVVRVVLDAEGAVESRLDVAAGPVGGAS